MPEGDLMRICDVGRFVIRALLAVLVFACGLNAFSQTIQLTQEDEKAITATIEAYRSAWLANDNKGVLKTFTDDAVLLPAHANPAVSGIAAIERYWFTPGGPATKITVLNITVDDVRGDGVFAYARGLDEVGWVVTEDSGSHRHFHPGTYLNVMKKLPDGTWRIQVHMWDDGPEQVD
jgi:uncharacterized protein (TIGR02246 family)